MAISLDSPSPSLKKDFNNHSPVYSPTSEKRFWSDLRNRVDTLLQNRKLNSDPNHISSVSGEELENEKRLLRKEDCLLLLRGFDSISESMCQLTSTLDAAVDGARELAKPSFTETFQSDLGKQAEALKSDLADDEGESRRGVKRKTSSHESSEDHEKKDNQQNLKIAKLKKAKNVAVSMATKAATLARQLKSIKSDLCFTQDRCTMLEEENRRLREGYGKGMRPEEDDLVRLQLEALLAEKARLANENANLTRENECLHQLVEYHQLTSQEDISTSYEQVMNGMCLDFSSPTRTINEEYDDEEDTSSTEEYPVTPRTETHGVSTSLNGWLGEEKQR
ncbi:hypothetical protein ACHQM5_027100 [Ranunculus cassubicifolius]